MVLPGMSSLTFKEFGKTFFRRMLDHNVAGGAAQIAYYLLLSLFPFLLVLVAVAAFLPLGGAVQDMMSRMRSLMPPQAMELIEKHLDDLLGTTRPRLLGVGLVVAIWSASRGVDAIRQGLNLSYDVKESRPWWKLNAAEVGMTILGTLLVPAALAMFAAGGKAGDWVATRLHVERYYVFLWGWLRWPATALLVMLVVALAYYSLPDVKQQFKYITTGSVLGTAAWLVATWGFTQYVEHFGNYNATYGSIGGVIVLMTWLYISGLIFLAGGEINAIIEHHSREGKARGSRAAGERPAPPLERPSAGQGKAGEVPLLH